MNDVEIQTYRATFYASEAQADNPENVSLMGTPATVTVPTRDGGESTSTGVVVEIGDGWIMLEFIA